jgi:hypothetical protein
MESVGGASPCLTARIAGVLYVLAGLTSVVGGIYIPGKLVVAGDAVSTGNPCVLDSGAAGSSKLQLL